MELGALDFAKQHRGDDRLPVLGAQGEARDKVGFGGEKMNWRTNAADGLSAHDCFLCWY
jgi:hypothetical protein